MSNDIISERGMPTSMRKFMNAVKPHVEFGKKPAPEPETADDAGARRTQEVTARANDEKKGYGFLRSLQKRAFGRKEITPAAPVERPERSEDERRDAIMARAKVNEGEDEDKECGQCEGTGTIEGGLSGDGDDEECPVCDGSGKLPE